MPASGCGPGGSSWACGRRRRSSGGLWQWNLRRASDPFRSLPLCLVVYVPKCAARLGHRLSGGWAQPPGGTGAMGFSWGVPRILQCWRIVWLGPARRATRGHEVWVCGARCARTCCGGKNQHQACAPPPPLFCEMPASSAKRCCPPPTPPPTGLLPPMSPPFDPTPPLRS